MQDLDEIIDPIKPDLDKVKEVFYELLDSRVTIINIIARHLVKQKGKWVRPILVILSARICGNITKESYLSAALIEMLHNATLIHDDVVDDATIRRGGPSLNSIWKNKITVLMGDYILAKSLSAAAQLKSLEAIDVLSNTSARMSRGEISQLIKSRKKDLTEAEYFEIIGDKTAALLSACCHLGGLTVTDDRNQIDALKNFGENLGLAFQIKDDILDIKGEEKVLGKKKGNDLKNGKITLPLIHSLSNVNGSLRRKVIRKVKKKGNRKDIKFLLNFIEENGGLEYSQNKADELTQTALAGLNIFPDSEYKDSLIKLSNFIVKRQN